MRTCFRPIAPRPVRTVSAYQKRREAEKQAAKHEALKRYVAAQKEKADVCTRD